MGLNEAFNSGYRLRRQPAARDKQGQRWNASIREVEEIHFLRLPRSEDGQEIADPAWRAVRRACVVELEVQDLGRRPIARIRGQEFLDGPEEHARLPRQYTLVAELLEEDELGLEDLHVPTEPPLHTDRVEGQLGDPHPGVDLYELHVERQEAHGEGRQVHELGDLADAVPQDLPVAVAHDLEVLTRPTAKRDERDVRAAELEEALEP